MSTELCPVSRVDERPFPSDLEGRINAIAKTVNNELKIATLLHLGEDSVDSDKILARLRETVGRGIRLVNGKNSLFIVTIHYCL